VGAIAVCGVGGVVGVITTLLCCLALLVLLGRCSLLVLGARVQEDVFRYELPGKSFKPCRIAVFAARVALGPEVQIGCWGMGNLWGSWLGDLGSGWHRVRVVLLQSCTLRWVTGLLQPRCFMVLCVLSCSVCNLFSWALCSPSSPVSCVVVVALNRSLLGTLFSEQPAEKFLFYQSGNFYFLNSLSSRAPEARSFPGTR